MYKKNKKRSIFAFVEGFLMSFFMMDNFNPEHRWGLRIIFACVIILFVVFLVYLFIFS